MENYRHTSVHMCTSVLLTLCDNFYKQRNNAIRLYAYIGFPFDTDGLSVNNEYDKREQVIYIQKSKPPSPYVEPIPNHNLSGQILVYGSADLIFVMINP